jgi:predicted LPLAT superfamily acyltransferase
MSQWQGKSKGTPAGYRVFVFLIRTFGIHPSYLLLRFVSLYYVFFSPASTRAILSFYRNILKFTTLNSWVWLYRNYFRFGQVLIDRVALLSGREDTFTFTFDGEERLRKMAADKKGGLLISGHAGNWESAGHLLTRMETKIHIVMYDGEDTQLRRYLDSVTGPKNFNIILVKEDLTHIYKITEAIAAGELVCMHADRFRPGNKTLVANFFGKPARFPEGPFLLALRLQVPLAFVYGFKETATHYHLYTTQARQFSRKNGDTMHGILDAFSSDLEKMVRKYPEQWFNYYNFWA